MPKIAKQKVNKTRKGPKGAMSSMPKIRGGRVSLSQLNAHPIYGGRVTSNVDSLPAAFVNILGNSTYYNEDSSVMMPSLGICPVRVVGCQPLTDITGAVATADVFTTGTLATATSVNAILCCPDALNGPLAAKANLYDKYVFRDLLFEYVSTCATTQVSALALAFTEDAQTLPGTFSTARQVVPSVAFPFRADRAFLHYNYNGPKLFYNLTDNSGGPGQRTTVQGVLNGYPSANLTVISPGFINVYYVCELYDPVASQGFTVSVRRDERDIVKELVENLRKMDVQTRNTLISDLESRYTVTPGRNLLRK